MTGESIRKMTSSCGYDEMSAPPSFYGPFLPVSDDEIETFNDILSDEIDSDFTSSICCCEHCYSDFRERWPDVAFRGEEFQSQNMDADYLIDNSRVTRLYSAAEISTLKHLVKCPRCLTLGVRKVWIFEHRFSDAPTIERAIEELLAVGTRTPFLMLEHPFALDVLRNIRQRAELAPAVRLKGLVFRARSLQSVTELSQKPGSILTYGVPPASKVGEGRFNHAGHPMLYLASSQETAAAELGIPGESCVVAALTLRDPVRVLDLVEIDEMEPGFEILDAVAQSALLAAPLKLEGWVKRQYVFSRFVADCARAAGFDAIRYGSTKLVNGFNYVLLSPGDNISASLSLISVETVTCPPASLRW
jgi:hypothetical protein